MEHSVFPVGQGFASRAGSHPAPTTSSFLLRIPWLGSRAGEIAATMYDANDVDLFFVDDPVNDAVTLKENFADVVMFGFGYDTAA